MHPEMENIMDPKLGETTDAMRLHDYFNAHQFKRVAPEARWCECGRMQYLQRSGIYSPEREDEWINATLYGRDRISAELLRTWLKESTNDKENETHD